MPKFRNLLVFIFWMSVPWAPASAQPPLSPNLVGASIVVIQAHPDDEQNLAPMLADACRFGSARCHFLVVADGNSYGCALVSLIRQVKPLSDPRACSARRRVEMRASAAILGGTVEFLGLDDLFYAFNNKGRDRTLAEWRKAEGGRSKLVDRMERVLLKRRATVLFALDPRHGSSCHAAHRAATTLALEAVARIGRPLRPAVWFEETSDLDEGLTAAQVGELDNGGLFVWPANRAPIASYDGGRLLANGQPAHAFRDMVHRLHASQDRAPGRSIATLSVDRLRLPLVRLDDIDPEDDYCTGLNIRIPTWEVPGNRERFLARVENANR